MFQQNLVDRRGVKRVEVLISTFKRPACIVERFDEERGVLGRRLSVASQIAAGREEAGAAPVRAPRGLGKVALEQL